MSAPPAEPGVEIKRGLCTPVLTAEREAQLRDAAGAAPRGVSFLATQRPRDLTPEERARIEASLSHVREEGPRKGGLLPSPGRVPSGWGAETAALRERVQALEAALAAVTARVRELEGR